MSDEKPVVVICGGGVIGTSVAYFLAKRGVFPVVIEKYEIAGAASGKAGGFLARNWNEDNALDKFSKLSFDLHATISKELNGEKEYGYRRLTSHSVTMDERRVTKQSNPDLPGWLDGAAVSGKHHKIGDTSTTAQVHPYQYCQTLQKECVTMGVQFLTRTEVTDIRTVEGGKKNIVTLNNNNQLSADVVVIAMGPWSGFVQKWIPSMPQVIYGQKAHSLTVFPESHLTADAVFISHGDLSPDIYPRPDGEVYCCGMAENSKPSLEIESVETVAVTPGACEQLKSIIDRTSTTIRESKINSKRACYIPLTQDGLPLIGHLSECEGIYVAAGHGCWGILNSPATGLALSELIIDGSCTSIDISSFCPDRFLEQ